MPQTLHAFGRQEARQHARRGRSVRCQCGTAVDRHAVGTVCRGHAPWTGIADTLVGC